MSTPSSDFVAIAKAGLTAKTMEEQKEAVVKCLSMLSRDRLKTLLKEARAIQKAQPSATADWLVAAIEDADFDASLIELGEMAGIGGEISDMLKK